MNISNIISDHETYKAQTLDNRFFKHHHIVQLLANLPYAFETSILGNSVNQLSINLVKWGNGAIKIMLWSQMHGDEATGTMALFDLFNFLQSDDELVNLLKTNCTLFIIPMVNPDGAAIFTRRNAQQIDINRDYLKLSSPEAKLLKECRAKLTPHFGFNLHDQTTLWSVANSLKPATLSFLAPAYNEDLNINETREQAMLVIADMFKDLNPVLPGQIGLFNDAYEPRAFGDNFQQAGMSTILIEAGGYENDEEKQHIRTYYFGAILAGLKSIATQKYLQQHQANYFAIPKNEKQLFHILIHQVIIKDIEVSIGVNYEEIPTSDGLSTTKVYSIEDIGDLSFNNAYTIYASPYLAIKGDIQLFKVADFELLENNQSILCFKNGKLL